jgi:phosphonate transport system substrate-binding protein
VPSCTRRAFLTATLAAAAVRSARSEAPPLRFGVTPVMLDDELGFLNRWARWLERQLGRPVVLVQRSRYRELLDLLLRGRLDLGWICGYPYVQHRKELSLIAVPRFQGRPLYHAYLIVAADSDLKTLADLQGRLFAWADPDSNSGYLYPRFLLTTSGKDPDHYFRRTFFTWGHPRSIDAVAEGLADAAAVDGYVWETLARRAPQRTAGTRVILRSPAFGFPPLVASAALPDALRRELRRLFLAQVQDAEGRALLADLNLDTFSIEEETLYDDIARMAARLAQGAVG